MRRRLQPAALAATVLALGSASALGASLGSSTTGRIGGHVSINASHLNAGHYTLLLLEIASHPKGGQQTDCLGKIASGTAKNGSLTLSGTVPSKLNCVQANKSVGTISTKTGKAYLVIGVFQPPGGFSANGSYVKRSITLTH